MIKNFYGQYRFLSNFYLCKVKYEGLYYGSVESAFQSAKTLDMDVRKQFTTLSPKDAKALGYKIELRSDWESVKDDIMYQLVRYKFRHSNKLKMLLLRTEDEILIEENSWGDTYWGKCKGVGQNKLGLILMRVRDEIRKEREQRDANRVR